MRELIIFCFSFFLNCIVFLLIAIFHLTRILFGQNGRRQLEISLTVVKPEPDDTGEKKNQENLCPTQLQISQRNLVLGDLFGSDVKLMKDERAK